jgi:hypothetical protein
MKTETLLRSAKVHRHQPLVQAQANRWESSFKLDTPKFQSCVQPKEFMVAGKNKKSSTKRSTKEDGEDGG